MSDALLKIKDLKIAYQTDRETVSAVNGVSFELQKGRTLGVVGETGAGKTTTALGVLRLLPDRTAKYLGGSVVFAGRELLGLTEQEMRNIRGEKISMIFQDPMTALNPILTVGEQIAEALLLHNHVGKSREQIERQVEKALEMVGIPAKRKKEYPHQFSGGMKQRVVIAIALACEPELLIADEPTTALDVTIQAQVLTMMNELKARLKTSVIMITHDLGIVAQTCDDVAIMYAGRFVEAGTLEDVFTGERRHPYTAGLFGSIPNLTAETERLSPIEGMMPDPTNLPEGCAFAPRCPHKFARCEAEQPPGYGGSHKIACHLFAGGETA